MDKPDLGINVPAVCCYIDAADMPIREQREAELTDITPARLSDDSEVHHLDNLIHIRKERQVVIWILILVLAIVNGVGFYLLWLKASRG